MLKTSHGISDLSYHIVLSAKCRRKVFVGGLEVYAKRLFLNIAAHYGYEIRALEVMPDHVHMLISALPSVAPLDIVSQFKSISANWIFKKFSGLKAEQFEKSGFWSKGYYIGAAGSASEEAVKHYIANQK
jgi:putative transposase